MPISPQRVGYYGRVWTINLFTDTGTENLTGVVAANIGIRIRSLTNPLADWTSTGAIVIVTSNPAQITWQPTATDYALAGSFEAIPFVSFPGAPAPVAYDPLPFVVQP